MTHLGHRPELPNGGLLRLDMELGQFVVTEYNPDRSVRRCARGDFEAMADLLDVWEAAALALWVSRPHGQPVREAPLGLRGAPPPAGPNTKQEGEAA